MEDGLRKYHPEYSAFGQMGQSPPKGFSGFIDETHIRGSVPIALLFPWCKVIKRCIGKQYGVLLCRQHLGEQSHRGHKKSGLPTRWFKHASFIDWNFLYPVSQVAYDIVNEE